MDWRHIHTDEDIDALFSVYGGFHDSCLTGLSYQAGAEVDEKGWMYFGGAEDRTLQMRFQSQWNKLPLLLRFGGVRRFSVSGWVENYTCEVFDCYLRIHTDLIPGRDAPLVVWADSSGFSPKNIRADYALAAPSVTFVIADALSWRLEEG